MEVNEVAVIIKETLNRTIQELKPDLSKWDDIGLVYFKSNHSGIETIEPYC